MSSKKYCQDSVSVTCELGLGLELFRHFILTIFFYQISDTAAVLGDCGPLWWSVRHLHSSGEILTLIAYANI